LHPSLTHRGPWLKHAAEELPILHGTLMRLKVERLPGEPRPETRLAVVLGHPHLQTAEANARINRPEDPSRGPSRPWPGSQPLLPGEEGNAQHREVPASVEPAFSRMKNFTMQRDCRLRRDGLH
jgi:hypothetical protein